MEQIEETTPIFDAFELNLNVLELKQIGTRSHYVEETALLQGRAVLGRDDGYTIVANVVLRVVFGLVPASVGQRGQPTVGCRRDVMMN